MNTQPTLFDAPRFAGKTVEAVDVPRLTYQLDRVFEVMRDGKFRTLSELSVVIKRRWPDTHDSEAALSARLRQLRGMGHTVNKERRGDPSRGLFQYQVLVNE